MQKKNNSIAAILGFLVVTIGIIFCIEIVIRFYFDHTSKIQKRMYTEYHKALKIDKKVSDVKQILILGNSLLLQGVYIDQLRESMGGKAELHRFVVENTSFFDWYFGIRRLFKEGSRPDFVFLMLDPAQLKSTNVRGEYFAYYLMSLADIMLVASELDLGPAEVSSFIIAKISEFYAVRKEVRKWLLQIIFPNIHNLMQKLNARSEYYRNSEDDLLNLYVSRLRKLADISFDYGVPLIFMVPPTGVLLDANAVRNIQQAGSLSGIGVIVPNDLADYQRDDFSDGYHLNENGAGKHTKAIISPMHEFIFGSY